jgi:rhodanese-related sulfurtransferase
MNPLLVASAIAAAVLILRLALKSRPSTSCRDASRAVQEGSAVLVDVREPGEWGSGVAQTAALLPLSDLRGKRERWGSFLKANSGKRIMLYCQSGMRSGMAASILKAEGFDAANIGSFQDWKRQGLPVRTP